MRSMAWAMQLALSILIAIVWMQSATAHMGNPYFFLSSVYKYQLVGRDLGWILAVVLPALQSVLAVCLLARVFVGAALLLSGLLLTVFSAVQISAFLRGIQIDCGCFGPAASNPIGQASIAMVVVLAMFSYIALACYTFATTRCAGEVPCAR
jgi:putative oxidoreductase